MDMSGTVQTTAYYRLEKSAAAVVITLPDRTEDRKFWLDDIEIKPERIQESRLDSGDFHLDISALSPNPRPVLTVEYRETSGSSFSLISIHHLNAPRFPDTTVIGSMMWEVTLPYDHYLFLNSKEFSPEFHWQRDTLLWDRHATKQAADVAAWLGSSVRAAAGDGNTYAFSRFGSAPTLDIGSMTQSAIILLGAGLSLVATFALLNLPKGRTTIVLVVLAIAVVVASLWFPEAVRLLMQPAALGFVLAFAAARLDRANSTSALALPDRRASAADFVATATSPSSIERALVNRVDPEAPTISRPTSEIAREPVSSFELGGPA